MARLSVAEAGGERVLAGLDAIAWSELGSEIIEQSDSGYNVLVGSKPGHVVTFPSYAAHPNLLQHLIIHHKDGSSSEVDSTAAGRYQILHRTSVGLHMPDFTPWSQDRAAIELIRECGALQRLEQGDFRNAIYMCAKTWASLPGAGYNQHENRIDLIAEAYFRALEYYASRVPS